MQGPSDRTVGQEEATYEPATTKVGMVCEAETGEEPLRKELRYIHGQPPIPVSPILTIKKAFGSLVTNFVFIKAQLLNRALLYYLRGVQSSPQEVA